MRQTHMLKKFIEEVWARYRAESSERQICLQLEGGDRFEVEESGARDLVTLRYFLTDEMGNVNKDLELVLFVDESGDWIPFEFYRAGTDNRVYGARNAQDGSLTITDATNQEALAMYCDGWSFHLREQKWLQHATKIMQATRRRAKVPRWPEPTSEEPDLETLEEWMWDSVCEATDGCICEPDGICEHGHPSWLLCLGLI